MRLRAVSSGPQSTLAPFAHLMREPHNEHARAAARAAWQTHGLILINPSWLTSWVERQQITNIADKLHGKRKG